MTTPQESLSEARRAARDLAAAVGTLDRSAVPAEELHQLAEDVARISSSLDLLTGRRPAPPGTASSLHDTDYDPRQFVDGAADVPSHHRH